MSGGNKGSVIFETPEGGQARLYVNKTGAASVKGTAVVLGAAIDESVIVAPADSPMVIGWIYNSGIADGEKVWVVGDGDCDALLQDSTAATRGYWVRSSITQAGRVNATLAVPPGGGIPEIDQHFRECGHCEENVSSGTNKLARIHIHLL